MDENRLAYSREDLRKQAQLLSDRIEEMRLETIPNVDEIRKLQGDREAVLKFLSGEEDIVNG